MKVCEKEEQKYAFMKNVATSTLLEVQIRNVHFNRTLCSIVKYKIALAKKHFGIENGGKI